MSEIQITITDSQNKAGQSVKVLKFTGLLDETNVDEKSKIIYDLLTATPKNLNMIFDFAELDYMNSKSVGYLTDWYTKVSNTGGGIVITGAKPNIQDILEVVGLTQIIKFVGTMEEAQNFTFGAQAQPEQAAQPAPIVQAAPPVAPAAPVAQPAIQPVQPTQPVETLQVAVQQPVAEPTPAAQPIEQAPQPATPAQQAPAPEATPVAQPQQITTVQQAPQPNVEITFNAETPPQTPQQ